MCLPSDFNSRVLEDLYSALAIGYEFLGKHILHKLRIVQVDVEVKSEERGSGGLSILVRAGIYTFPFDSSMALSRTQPKLLYHFA